jgi:hypothetical protein
MSATEDPSSDASGMAEEQAPALLGGDVREGYADIGDVRLHYVGKLRQRLAAIATFPRRIPLSVIAAPQHQ